MTKSTTRVAADLETFTQTEITAKDVVAKAGRKNLIINGAFQIAQRGASFTGLTGFKFIADRWGLNQYVSNSALADSAIVTGPTAGTQAIEVTVATVPTSLNTTSYCTLRQSIEGSNFTPATSFGSSDAKALTFSFWHKHSIAGTYSVILRNGSSDLNLLIDYAQSSADAWEKTTLSIPAATVGTFYSDTQRGFSVEFTLTNGTAYQSAVTNQWFSGSYYHSTPNQTQMFLSAGSKFRIANVQLELGSVATDFEHRSYGEELALCQRYFRLLNWETLPFSITGVTGTNDHIFTIYYSQMRATPDLTHKSGTFRIYANATNAMVTAWTGIDTNLEGLRIYISRIGAAYEETWWDAGNPITAIVLHLDAEL
jgi:hypothetical protein